MRRWPRAECRFYPGSNSGCIGGRAFGKVRFPAGIRMGLSFGFWAGQG